MLQVLPERASNTSSWVVVGYFYSRSGYAGARLTVKAHRGGRISSFQMS